MKLSKFFQIFGIILLSVCSLLYLNQNQIEKTTLIEATNYINQSKQNILSSDYVNITKPEFGTTFGILYVEKLDKEIAIIEGTDLNSLSKGAGHMPETAMPSEGEQIIVSGHRDTVFSEFSELNIGDIFTLKMPYGEFRYKIKETKIVDRYDTTIVGSMNEEVLLVTTCYPFSYLGDAPYRFIFYAYPI